MLFNSFLKVACISPVVEVGCPMKNVEIIVEAIKNSKAKVNLFPELCITGYSCGDLFFQDSLLNECYQAIDYLLKNNPSDGIVMVGSPLRFRGSLVNAVLVIQKDTILGVVPKMHLPNYREFYEKRWFSQGIENESSEIVINNKHYPFGNLLFTDYEHNLSFGVEICEDMWTALSPGNYLALAGANMIFNASASNEYFEKDIMRANCVADNSRRNTCAYIYASSGINESTSETIFSGHNIIASCGKIIANDLSFDPNTHYTYADLDLIQINYNRHSMTNLHQPLPKEYHCETIEFSLPTNDRFVFSKNLDSLPFVPKDNHEASFKRISNILEYSLYKHVKQIGAKTLIIGVSGGLDSTLALLIAYQAFKHLGYDAKNIIGVTMPAFATSTRTKNNAVLLMEKLGITVLEKPITEEVLQHFKLIDHDPNCFDITYENVQARYRTLVLMNLANKYNGIVLGTGDMSELALGWCTYNGDQMSMYGINAGMPKTLVRYMTEAYGNYVFTEVKEILADVVATPISPELKAEQVTEDSIGKYEINDYILYRYLFCGDTDERISWLLELVFSLSQDEASRYVKNFFARFFSQQYKRQAMPEGPKVLAYSLSPRSDFRMPSDLSRR